MIVIPFTWNYQVKGRIPCKCHSEKTSKPFELGAKVPTLYIVNFNKILWHLEIYRLIIIYSCSKETNLVVFTKLLMAVFLNNWMTARYKGDFSDCYLQVFSLAVRSHTLHYMMSNNFVVLQTCWLIIKLFKAKYVLLSSAVLLILQSSGILCTI